MSDQRSIEDGGTGAGSVNTVTRHGAEVHRPAGPWTPAVHELLEHLHDLPFTPRPLRRTPDMEVLEYLEGEVALRPWPEVLRTLDGMEAVAQMVRTYHNHVRDFVPSPHARWRVPDLIWRPGQILRHGDLGPWNLVWQGTRLTGLIDWDFAEPGTTLQDIAQLAWYCIPLHHDTKRIATGISPHQVRPRLERLCHVFAVTSAEVLCAVQGLQELELSRMASLQIEPWTTFLARGDREEIRADMDWLVRFQTRL